MVLYVPSMSLLLTLRRVWLQLQKPLLVVVMLWQCTYYIQWRLLLVIISNNQILVQYLAPSGIILCSISNHLFWSYCLYPISVSLLNSSYIYKYGLGPLLFGVMFLLIIVIISILKFTLPFSLASSNTSSSRDLEYEYKEHHEWIQQWNFKKQSRQEN